MTPDAFSTLAVRAGHGVVTYPILDSVQFRFGGKAFMTLGWPEAGWAAVKLDPRDERWALALSGGLTVEPNGPARAGVVLVQLAAVQEGWPRWCFRRPGGAPPSANPRRRRRHWVIAARSRVSDVRRHEAETPELEAF